MEEEKLDLLQGKDSNSDENKNLTRIGNKFYDEDTLKRITIVRLTQVGVHPSKIKNILNISNSLLYKWINYKKRQPKKMGRLQKFNNTHKEFIYKEAEGKLTVANKASSRNIASKFHDKFNQDISYSYVCKLLLKKFGRPYRGLNCILLNENHISQRLEFSNFIIDENIQSCDIMITDECRVVLYPKINPKINMIRFGDNDKKNLHTYEVNKKRTYDRPKFETSIMIEGSI